MSSSHEDLIRRRDLLIDQIKVAADEDERRRLYDELESVLRQLQSTEQDIS